MQKYVHVHKTSNHRKVGDFKVVGLIKKSGSAILCRTGLLLFQGDYVTEQQIREETKEQN